MATTATTNGRTTKAKPRGFKGLDCPACGESAPELTLSLTDLATVHCDACGDDYAIATAIKMLTDKLAAWVKLQRWIDLAGELATDDETE